MVRGIVTCNMGEFPCPWDGGEDGEPCDRVLNSRMGMKQHYTQMHEPFPNCECYDCGCRFRSEGGQRKYCDDCWEKRKSNKGKHNPNYDGGKEQSNCVECGADIFYYPSEKKGLYCEDCQEEKTKDNLNNVGGKQETEEYFCYHCNKKITRSNIQQSCEINVALCSKGCFKAAEDIDGRVYLEEEETTYEKMECSVCGQDLLRGLSKSYSVGPFCSDECLRGGMSAARSGEDHHQWKDWETGYTGDWWRVRREARERDDNECQLCGAHEGSDGRAPDAHHIWPVAWFRAHDEYEEDDAHVLSNVVMLCQSCHRNVEYDNTDLPAGLLDEKNLVEPPESYVALKQRIEENEVSGKPL